MIAILTNPEVVTVQSAPPHWSVESLLKGVATAEPHHHALIDVVRATRTRTRT